MPDTAPIPVSSTTAWNTAFENLRARYPKVREPIVVALHILMQNPDVALADAKAQAALHGARITAASVAAAQRLLSREDQLPAAAPTPVKSTPTTPARVRRAAKNETTLDIEGLIRGTAARISAQGAADADRLRVAIRRAIDVLQAAVGA